MPRSPSPTADVVAAQGLHVAYGAHRVLTDIDLTVRRGEALAVIGANGSGKSTLIRSLVGLVPVAAGTVRLFGSSRFGRAERERIGYVPQRVGVSGGVPSTVAEVVGSGLHSGIFRRTSRHGRQAVERALAATGIEQLSTRPVETLSGGQQQRVLIARALVREPELLLLDEPLAGVDLEQQSAFAETLRALAADDRTIVLVLHEFGPLAPLLTRVISLDGGRIEFDATPDDAPERCATNDMPEWVHAAHDHVHRHDHVHPHDTPEQPGAEWVPEALPARGAHQ